MLDWVIGGSWFVFFPLMWLVFSVVALLIAKKSQEGHVENMDYLFAVWLGSMGAVVWPITLAGLVLFGLLKLIGSSKFGNPKPTESMTYSENFAQLASYKLVETGVWPIEIQGTSLSELSKISARNKRCNNPINCGETSTHNHGFYCTPTCTLCGKVK